MGGKSPSHRTADGAYNGAMPIVHSFGTLLATTAASKVSTTYAAPFDTKVKAFAFDIKALPAATGRVNLRVAGTSVAVKDLNGQTNNTMYQFGDADFTTTFKAIDKLVTKGQRLTVTLENKATMAGQGVVVMNPL
jgi:hypothetical protein